MNRAERRNTVKNLQKKGMKRDSARDFVDRVDYAEHSFAQEEHWEGEKVKLNYDRITSYRDYPKMHQAYKDFVEENKDKVLTVEFDEIRKKEAEKNKGKSSLVQFAEDTNEPKFLFFGVDLIPEPNQIQPKTETELQNEVFINHVNEIMNKME